MNHLLLTEGLSFRHTGWHSTELQPSSTHPSPHRSQDSASAAHGQGLCAHSGPQRLRTGVGVTLLGPGAEMSLCSPARSCSPALATAGRHGLQPRGCRASIPQPPRVRVLPSGDNPSRSRPPEQGALSSRAVGAPGAHASPRHRNTRAGAEPRHRSSRGAGTDPASSRSLCPGEGSV